MAPRNNTKNKNTNQKRPKSSKPRIVKSNPKSPNDIKIEVPGKKSSARPRKVSTKKQELSDEQKIILADEVVKYQLNKKSRILNFNKKIPTVEVINDESKSERVVLTFFQEHKGQDGQVIENVKKKAIKKTTSESNAVAKKPLTRKRSADSTQKSQTAQKPSVKPKRTRITRNSVKAQKKEIIEGKANVKEDLKNKHENSSEIMINLQTNGTRSPVSKCAGRIESRKTSSTSNSCMSWTKDLSSSSKTSLPATSNDFVRIDNKLPVLKLTCVNSKKTNETAKPVIKVEDNYSVNSHSCDSTNSNSSTSSLSTLPNNNTQSHQSDMLKDELSKAFDKLTSKLKYFDVEIMRWIGYGKESTGVSLKGFQDKILTTLKEECEVISHCRNLKSILSDDSELKSGKDPDEVVVETHSDKLDVTSRNVAEYGSKSKNSLIHQVVHNAIPDTVCNDNNHANSKPTESYDDDDAISIYAESITGIESEKLANSITTPPKNFEYAEYIPEPIKKIETMPKKYSYCPTKINENNKLIVKKSICEKQNADSTSIFKDNYFGRASEGDVNSISSECTQNDINDVPTKIALIPQAAVNREPVLVNDTRNRQGQGSGVLKDVCNFNIFNRCKNAYCRYLHIVPDVLEVKTKLQCLNDDEFVSEYRAIRHLYAVSRKYGLCFVEECCNRDMLRLSLDMAIHFFAHAIIKNKEDSVTIREILECVLLKLNNVDLNVCEDLLMKSVTSTMLLCDIFMQTIAETQNFSRFKKVFLNLTHFIVNRDGIFNLYVAEHILERVCILPPEKPLARALLDIMRNTDTAIFKNSMIGKFENILLTLDKKLHGDFLTVKMEAIGCLLASPSLSSASSHYSNNMESIIPVNNIPNIGEKAYISPDTTDANDSKNKFFGTAKLTRTVNFSKPQFNKVVKMNPTYEYKEKWQKAKNFKSWTQKPMNKFPPPLLDLPVTKPVLEPNKSKHYVAYRPTVTRYQKRPQRDLF